ncbi:MAG: hypothetical protein HUJ54_15165, partial [Erysipelotrichaceae bacterium]|nr:hypothetical protein [Erysipelotrichaceae bacterium]
MNLDFHYYATYCAACLAGYTPEEAADISYAAAMVDNCTATYLQSVKGPEYAATTQTNAELATFSMNALNRQLITRIWSSFHFLPKDLEAQVPGKPKGYMNKYRLIAGPNGKLVKKTVEQAQENGHLAAIGVAMHVLADTWAHANFAGTPSLVINNTNNHFYEVLEEDGKPVDKQMKFIHSLGAPDNLDESIYVNTLYQPTEYSIMSLGHGRAGHLPDYSFVKYKYLPA